MTQSNEFALMLLRRVHHAIHKRQSHSQVLKTITDMALGQLGDKVSQAALFEFDSIGNTISLTAVSGTNPFSIQPGDKFPSAGWPTKAPVFTRNITVDPRMNFLNGSGTQSSLEVPMQHHHGTCAVLAFYSPDLDAFIDDDADLFLNFGQAACMALQTARLVARSQHQVTELDMLNALAAALASTLDETDLLEIIYQHVQQVMDADNLHLAFYDQETDELDIAYLMENGEKQQPIRLKAGNSLTRHVVRTGETLFLRGNLLAQATRQRANPTSRLPLTWVGVPLKTGEQMLGVLSVQHYSDADAYNKDQIRLLEAVASQGALALQNGRAFGVAHQAQRKLTTILNAMSDLIIVLDEQENITLVNDAAARQFQVEVESIIHQPLSTLGIDSLVTVFETSSNSDRPVVREVQIQDKIFHTNILSIQDMGWLIVMQDITQLKEFDHIRTEWVSAVSHDMKNPLAIAQLSADLLEQTGALDTKQQRIVYQLQQGLRQMKTLVVDVLDLAKFEADLKPQKESIDLKDVIENAFNLAKPLARSKRHTLTKDLPSDLPFVNGDANMLTRVLVNLLSNAVKYTPSGGKLTLRAGVQENNVQVAISDNGCGISAKAIPLLFNRFYREPNQQSALADSTGLGLSIVKNIVEKHGGRIWVESSPGKGSNFTFTLPTYANGRRATNGFSEYTPVV